MAAPAPSWNTVRVFATWDNLDGTLKAGKYTVTIPVRVTNATDDVIVPAGTTRGVLQTGSPTAPSLDIQVPATDDPDNSPNGWQVTIKVSFDDLSATETYVIDVPVVSAGIDLRTVVLPQTLPAPQPVLIRGVAGGLAELNSSGLVTNADGSLPSGGGTALTSYVTQVETLGDYPAAFPSVNEVEIVVYSGSVGTTRPGAEFVVWQGFPTQPTNMADGDLWLSDTGGTILSGTAAPTGTDGANGDFYIRTSTSMLYGPKASGAWPSGVSLVGATGPAGTNGTNGTNGGLTPTASKTSAYTAAANDFVRCDASGGAFTVTLPTPTAGVQIGVKKTDSSTNAVTVATTSGTIDGASTRTVSVQYAAQVYVADGTNWQRVTVPQVTAIAATGTASSTTYLRGDGSWATPAGGGGSFTPSLKFTLPSGAVAATHDRTQVAMGSQTLTSGTIYAQAIVLRAGDVVTSVSFKTISGYSGATHQWAGVADSGLVIRAVSADDTSASVAVSTVKTFTMGSAYTVPSDGMYYLFLNVTATTPSLMGIGSQSTNQANIAPITTGTSGTGQTTPPATSSSLAALTAAAGVSPYMWVS